MGMVYLSHSRRSMRKIRQVYCVLPVGSGTLSNRVTSYRPSYRYPDSGAHGECRASDPRRTRTGRPVASDIHSAALPLLERSWFCCMVCDFLSPSVNPPLPMYQIMSPQSPSGYPSFKTTLTAPPRFSVPKMPAWGGGWTPATLAWSLRFQVWPGLIPGMCPKA